MVWHRLLTPSFYICFKFSITTLTGIHKVINIIVIFFTIFIHMDYLINLKRQTKTDTMYIIYDHIKYYIYLINVYVCQYWYNCCVIFPNV